MSVLQQRKVSDCTFLAPAAASADFYAVAGSGLVPGRDFTAVTFPDPMRNSGPIVRCLSSKIHSAGVEKSRLC